MIMTHTNGVHQFLKVLVEPETRRLLPWGILTAMASFPILLLLFLLAALHFHPSRSLAAKPTPEQFNETAHKIYKRRLAWIPTAFAAVSMTVISLPFVIDLACSVGSRSGFDIRMIKQRDVLAAANAGIFMGYLANDLLLSRCFYRNSFTLMTGWIHHIGYLVLLSHLSISHPEWLSIFALAGFMELPTFISSLPNLFPRLRDATWTIYPLRRLSGFQANFDLDLAFTVTFFLTRIVYHLVLIVLYSSAYGRATVDEIWQPAVFLICAMPMHVWWMKSALDRFARRRRRSSSQRFRMAEKGQLASVQEIAKSPDKSEQDPSSARSLSQSFNGNVPPSYSNTLPQPLTDGCRLLNVAVLKAQLATALGEGLQLGLAIRNSRPLNRSPPPTPPPTPEDYPDITNSEHELTQAFRHSQRLQLLAAFPGPTPWPLPTNNFRNYRMIRSREKGALGR